MNIMKKVLLLTFVACVAMMFGSCQKEVELSGTTWKAHQTINQTLTMEGVTGTVDMTLDCMMKFADATTGSLDITMGGTVAAMGMTIPVPTQTSTQAFTYTFDGEREGVLTASDAEAGENISIPFIYNKEDKTISFSINTGEESGLDLNFDLVFTQQ